MKIYQRTEKRGGYSYITTVKENGEYERICRFDDGKITSRYKDNILNFGWRSVNEFLRERPKFQQI